MNRQVIAYGPFTLVERCHCGAMYLTVGPVCMKLDPSVLPELRDTLAQAARTLGRDAKVAQLPAAPEPGEAAGEDGKGREEGSAGVESPGGGPSCDIN